MASSRILFACMLNATRSPMAEGILQSMGNYEVESCGTTATSVDPFSVSVCQEHNIDISGHISRSFEDLPRALPFAQTIALSQQAYEAALALPDSFTGTVHFWPIAVPATSSNRREQQLIAYRELFDQLSQKIHTHFS